MGFLKIPLSWKDFNTKKSRDLLMKSSLSLSYLLHNSMSQKLFEEASKCRNKKQEEKRKLNRKKLKREISNDKLFILSIYFLFANGDHIRDRA